MDIFNFGFLKRANSTASVEPSNPTDSIPQCDAASTNKPQPAPRSSMGPGNEYRTIRANRSAYDRLSLSRLYRTWYPDGPIPSSPITAFSLPLRRLSPPHRRTSRGIEGLYLETMPCTHSAIGKTNMFHPSYPRCSQPKIIIH